jgi:ribosomal protein S18 acetylase RimI-like enzyme
LFRVESYKYEVFQSEATMPWTIRQGRPADAPTIVEFNRRLAMESEGKALDAAALAAGVAAALADPTRKGPYYLAVDGATILGQLQITFEWSDWRNGWFWWIQSVYVRAGARQRGVFRSLYAHVVELARREQDVVGLRLYVERDNHAAQRTYQRLGMEQTAYLLLEQSPV